MFSIVGLSLLAPVANGSERVVVVEATLADPVSLLTHTVLLLLTALLTIFGLDCSFLSCRYKHMLRLAFLIFTGLSLLTSMAVLTTFEVVVLTFGALPTAIWELVQRFLPCLVIQLRFLTLLALGLVTLAGHLHSIERGILGRVVVEPVRLTDETRLEVIRAERIITNTIVCLSAELANGISGLIDEYQFR